MDEFMLLETTVPSISSSVPQSNPPSTPFSPLSFFYDKQDHVMQDSLAARVSQIKEEPFKGLLVPDTHSITPTQELPKRDELPATYVLGKRARDSDPTLLDFHSPTSHTSSDDSTAHYNFNHEQSTYQHEFQQEHQYIYTNTTEEQEDDEYEAPTQKKRRRNNNANTNSNTNTPSSTRAKRQTKRTKKNQKQKSKQQEEEDYQDDDVDAKEDTSTLSKKQQRLVKNRQAAHQFRVRQKQHMQELEETVEQQSKELEDTKTQLLLKTERLDQLQKEVEYLRSLNQQIVALLPKQSA